MFHSYSTGNDLLQNVVVTSRQINEERGGGGVTYKWFMGVGMGGEMKDPKT